MPSKEQLQPFIYDLEEGAIYFSKSTRTIRRWLQKAGIYQPKIKYNPGKVDKKKACEIRRLSKLGCTQAEIGKQLQLSQTTVGKIINNDANLALSGKAIVNFNGQDG